MTGPPYHVFELACFLSLPSPYKAEGDFSGNSPKLSMCIKSSGLFDYDSMFTLQEPLVLSVLISLLTRVYSLKNTDNDIDRTNDFSSVWPDNIP